MIKKLFGLCMVLFAGLLTLVILLGIIGLVTSDDTDGRLASAVVFAIVAILTALCARFGFRLLCAPTPAPVAKRPHPVQLQPEAAAVAHPAPPADGAPTPLKAPLSPIGAFPGRRPVEPYTPTYDEASQHLIQDLLALNRRDLPFRVVDGRSEGVDLIAEWKIVDAEFYALFAKAGVQRVFRIFMKLDPRKRTVRTKDQDYGVRWNKGVPTILAAEYFQGQKFSLQRHAEIAIRKDTKRPGVVVNYKFSTAEMKNPIKAVIKAAGWRYKGVAFAKL